MQRLEILRVVNRVQQTAGREPTSKHWVRWRWQPVPCVWDAWRCGVRADRHTHKERLILYHAQCYDGFGAAWAAWKLFGETGDYLPVMHGHPFPQVPLMAYRHMYILDFSYSR